MNTDFYSESKHDIHVSFKAKLLPSIDKGSSFRHYQIRKQTNYFLKNNDEKNESKQDGIESMKTKAC